MQLKETCTSEEEALDAVWVVGELYGLGQHSDGRPMVSKPLLHLRQNPNGMHTRVLGIIQ